LKAGSLVLAHLVLLGLWLWGGWAGGGWIYILALFDRRIEYWMYFAGMD